MGRLGSTVLCRRGGLSLRIWGWGVACMQVAVTPGRKLELLESCKGVWERVD